MTAHTATDTTTLWPAAYTEAQIDEMVAAYIECALWASLNFADDDGRPFDEDYDVDDFAPEAVAEARADCAGFARTCAADLADMEPAQAGHDFWLTRNHHGAGFWDRGLGERGERLTREAYVYGDVNPYAAEDGRLYFA